MLKTMLNAEIRSKIINSYLLRFFNKITGTPKILFSRDVSSKSAIGTVVQ